MTDVRFELRPFFGRGVHGRAGVVGGVGRVTVEVVRRKKSGRAGPPQSDVRVSGDGVPDVVYQPLWTSRPTIRNARLSVGGAPVRLAFNRRAVRNEARGLTFEAAGRAYRYVAGKGGWGGTLTRDGVVVALTLGKNPAGQGMSSFGEVTGPADGTDLALAALFEEVDTLEITVTGAVTGVVHRMLTPRVSEAYPE
ncbi:hypothetical protein [Streptomyces sp. ACT015]|uniref:hypothetical protein n=1 Tax=Streptomyces sp. ACT015 TaxID=3134807 RepID=UPI003D17EC64